MDDEVGAAQEVAEALLSSRRHAFDRVDDPVGLVAGRWGLGGFDLAVRTERDDVGERATDVNSQYPVSHVATIPAPPRTAAA